MRSARVARVPSTMPAWGCQKASYLRSPCRRCARALLVQCSWELSAHLQQAPCPAQQPAVQPLDEWCSLIGMLQAVTYAARS